MSTSVLSFRLLQYLTKLIIHDTTFFASNFGMPNLIRLHGSSVYAGVAAGATEASIGVMIEEVAAGVAAQATRV